MISYRFYNTHWKEDDLLSQPKKLSLKQNPIPKKDSAPLQMIIPKTDAPFKINFAA